MELSCKDIAPIITMFFVFEIIFFLMLFLGLRLLICGNKDIFCLGVCEGLLGFLIIIYFKLFPTCEMLLN